VRGEGEAVRSYYGPELAARIGAAVAAAAGAGPVGAASPLLPVE
jgi:hypothetical protein